MKLFVVWCWDKLVITLTKLLQKVFAAFIKGWTLIEEYPAIF